MKLTEQMFWLFSVGYFETSTKVGYKFKLGELTSWFWVVDSNSESYPKKKFKNFSRENLDYSVTISQLKANTFYH